MLLLLLRMLRRRRMLLLIRLLVVRMLYFRQWIHIRILNQIGQHPKFIHL